ncbi:heterokaryon incompatibility protein-domain-containing protein [Xylaria bambusicola]|uniref:heterokaryon incompatibility protein-domain-containing protein n=1 Tax=Xylaria bambusicola TaxID=326684 RepID=UPI002008DA2D|nr:heterokaryon incompatibility protein-domain-containing protein [Xylaria bambusicola]KAI0503170.1 heterokaryon incompatibility protein-domain-containing protein [Xylaria bambusicola]
MESNTDDSSHTLYQTVTADGPDSIRLIHLLPGGLTDELRCALVRADLSAYPHYEALSYVWGKPVFDAAIVCNEEVPFKITSSLHRALVRLRAVDRARVLWVDQICINQASKLDRTAQVARMTRIYSRCQNAIVWLGDVPPKLQTTLVEFIQTLSNAQKQQHRDGLILGDNDLSTLQLSDMDAAQRKRYGLPNSLDPRWKVLLYIYASLWMRRTWIVQEVALPRKVDVLIGPVLMDWRSLSSILFYVESLKVSGMNFGSLGSWKAFLALGARRVRTQEGEFSPLSELLFEHRRGKATDARDRIYGLMGLSAEREEMPLADYAASTPNVFMDATIDMFRRSGNLDILGLVGSMRPDRPEYLPSWVPDYGSAQGPHPITKRGTLYASKSPQVSTKFAASGHGQLSFKIDGHALVLPAMILSEILELAGCCMGQRDDDVDVQYGIGQVILNYAFKALQDHIEEINTSLSWETLTRRVMGRSPIYKPTGESMQDAFFMTYYEGQIERVTDEIRAIYAIDRFAFTVWRILTLGHGCTWLPAAIPLIAVVGFVLWMSKPAWTNLGYPSVSTLEKYADMRKDVTDRRLCTTTDGLVGLAPPDSAPGDKLALLQGGRVPVVLRQDVDGYRLVGEAYLHGAMYGEMMDAQKVVVIKIR